MKAPLSDILLMLSLVLLVSSVILPWFSIHYVLPWAIYPPFQVKGDYWSFHADFAQSQGYPSPWRRVGSYWFQQLWYSRFVGGYVADDLSLSIGWLIMFALQITAFVTLFLAALKYREGFSFVMISTATFALIFTLVVGSYQFVRYSAFGLGVKVQPEMGFFLAIVAVLLLLAILMLSIRSSRARLVCIHGNLQFDVPADWVVSLARRTKYSLIEAFKRSSSS